MVICATISSCSDEIETTDLLNDENGKAVGFGVLESRASATTIATVKNGFGVFAYENTSSGYDASVVSNYMCNEVVKYDESKGKWYYEPIKYWPMTGNNVISFFAYAPYMSAPQSTYGFTSIPTKNSTGHPKFHYVLGPKPSQHVDFVYASCFFLFGCLSIILIKKCEYYLYVS